MSRYHRFSLARGFSQLLRLILPAVAVAVSAAVASAQGFGITEGSRIKVSAVGQKSVTGIVRSISSDSTTIYVDGQAGILKFANSDIRDLAVSRGRTHVAGVKKGLLWGTGVGAVLGSVVLAAPAAESDYRSSSYTKQEMAAQTFIGSLIWGAGLGALIQSEEWNDLPLRPSVATSSGSLGVSLAFSPSFLH